MSVNLYKNGNLIPIAGNGGGVEVDAELSADSENPVQNKAIDAKIKELESGISQANNAFSELKDVAKTGSYNDLTDKPSIPEAVIVDSELADSANPVQNRAVKAEIDSINRRVVKKENVEVAETQWVEDESAAGYGFKADIPVDGVTGEFLPLVSFSPSDISSGNFATVAETGAGIVSVFAKEKPESAITILTIFCIL